MSVIVRVWQERDLKDIENHLFVFGELTGDCYKCRAIGLEIQETCPQCHTQFKYAGFRRKVTLAFVAKFKQKYSAFECIDFDDFKRVLSKHEARKLLDI